MKPGKFLTLLLIAVLGLLAVPASADLYPGFHALDPAVCTPPPPPAQGQPGYGSSSPLPNGSYYDPNTGFWFIPDGVWQGEPGARMIEVIAEIDELLTRPAWATEPPVDGLYWFAGGYWISQNWYQPGYYEADFIW